MLVLRAMVVPSISTRASLDEGRQSIRLYGSLGCGPRRGSSSSYHESMCVDLGEQAAWHKRGSNGLDCTYSIPRDFDESLQRTLFKGYHGCRFASTGQPPNPVSAIIETLLYRNDARAGLEGLQRNIIYWVWAPPHLQPLEKPHKIIA